MWDKIDEVRRHYHTSIDICHTFTYAMTHKVIIVLLNTISKLNCKSSTW